MQTKSRKLLMTLVVMAMTLVLLIALPIKASAVGGSNDTTIDLEDLAGSVTINKANWSYD